MSPPLGNTFRWFIGGSGNTSAPIGDFGPYDYIDAAPSVTTQYWAQIKNGTCISRTTTVTVYVCIPTITQQPASVLINANQTATLTTSRPFGTIEAGAMASVTHPSTARLAVAPVALRLLVSTRPAEASDGAITAAWDAPQKTRL